MLDKKASHYKFFDKEVIEIMEELYGTKEVMIFCKLNALKYRLRAGKKENAIRDIEKAMNYENYYKLLKAKLDNHN